MSAPTAIITGALGQDGRLLAQHLVELNYRVVGVVRPQKTGSTLVPEISGITYETTDLTSSEAVGELLDAWSPDEVYHLAASHHSAQEHSSNINMASREAMIRDNFLSTKVICFALEQRRVPCHLLYAGSSQMFVPVTMEQRINEESLRNPATFYGHTKSWSADLLGFMRSELGLSASTVILFNHESSLRDPRFVTRKISRAVAEAAHGLKPKVKLANIGALVDWSSARDVVRAMRLVAASNRPGDYVVASGMARSVRDLLEVAFRSANLDWKDFVEYQSDEPLPHLIGDSRKLEHDLGWMRSTGFDDMVTEMVRHDISALAA